MYESMLNHPNSPFGQFERLRREFDDLFGASALPNSIRSVAAGTWPAINVGRTPTSVEIYAFAPGLDPARIEVTLDRGVLRIAGERASAFHTASRLQVDDVSHSMFMQIEESYKGLVAPDDIQAALRPASARA